MIKSKPLFLKNTSGINYRSIDFTILQLLQRNIHLGASTEFSLLSSQWFIAGVRQKFTILNLNFTVSYYRRFLILVELIIFTRKHILFVNERKYFDKAVSDIASSVGEPFVMGRWVGGTLTNFKKVMVAYNILLKNKSFNSLTRYKWNLKQSLDGLSVLNSLPGALFFNSTKNNFWASREAYSLRIPSASITDSDSYPSDILYPIPGNDDAFGSIYFLNQLYNSEVKKLIQLHRSNNVFYLFI